MKKCLLVCLMLLAAVGLILVGCSRSKGGSSDNTLEIWHVQNTGQGPGIIERAVERFKKDNPSFKVNIVVIANDVYKQRLAVAAASGQMPDCFFSWTGGPMYEYVNNNAIVDLTPYMNANNYKDRILDGAIAQGTYQGKIWGLPAMNMAVCMVFYNKEIFEKYNLKVPATIRGLETVCDTLKANGITPFSLANKTQWTGSMYFMYLATRHGGVQPFINAVDGSGSFTHPAFIYAGEKIQEWVKKDYFLPGFNGLDWDSGQARAPMYRGETAMLIMGSWFISQAGGEDPGFFSKMGMFKFPADEQGTGNPNTVVGTLGDNFYHVSSTSKNPEKAFELLTHLIDDEAVGDYLADGRIPPVKGVKLTDPMLAELFNVIQQAPDIQLWYDQSLSADAAQVHLVTSQEMFGLTLSPADAARRLQDAQAAYLKKR
jgi:raffinose/stachyose/melibiose transport system substrate-binding protein